MPCGKAVWIVETVLMLILILELKISISQIVEIISKEWIIPHGYKYLLWISRLDFALRKCTLTAFDQEFHLL